jgi:ribosomal protein S18 acetylase RimI-like enzyme
MLIEKATMNDLDAVTELFDLYRQFYEQVSDLEGARGFLKARIENDDSVIFIAFEKENPIGFVQLYPSFSSVGMKPIWILNDLYVKKSARKNGAGEKLIQKAIQFAEGTGAKGVLLETGKENVKAQRLYEKIGFHKESNFFYYFSI